MDETTREADSYCDEWEPVWYYSWRSGKDKAAGKVDKDTAKAAAKTDVKDEADRKKAGAGVKDDPVDDGKKDSAVKVETKAKKADAKPKGAAA